jgi:hypothetical protein
VGGPSEGLTEWRHPRDRVARLVRLPFDRLADWWRERH